MGRLTLKVIMGKRKHKLRKRKQKVQKSKVKLYPVIMCTGEDIYIGVSHCKLRKNKKVDADQWRVWNSVFRKGYRIDMSDCEPGQMVCCPVCGAPVDFRLFPSSTLPMLAEVCGEKDSEASIKELPEA